MDDDPMVFCESCGHGFKNGVIYYNGDDDFPVWLCCMCKDGIKEVDVAEWFKKQKEKSSEH